MPDRQTMHADDCWSWGPRHYECALREIEALRAEVERLADAEREIKALRRELEEWKNVSEARAGAADDAEAHAEELAKALAELITWIPSADTYRRLGFDPEAPMRALKRATLSIGSIGGLSNEQRR